MAYDFGVSTRNDARDINHGIADIVCSSSSWLYLRRSDAKFRGRVGIKAIPHFQILPCILGCTWPSK